MYYTILLYYYYYSNQNGVGTKVPIEELKAKIEAILAQIPCPVDVVCAFKKDMLRKPRIGSYELLKKLRVEGPGAGVFTYVGDAAGRPKNG
jgi:DNA 3'-phosphatase